MSSEDFHHLVGILSVATPILSIAKSLQVIAIHASLVHICKWLNLNNSNFEMIVDGTYCWRARSQPCWNLRFHILSRPGFRSDILKQFLFFCFLLAGNRPWRIFGIFSYSYYETPTFFPQLWRLWIVYLGPVSTSHGAALLFWQEDSFRFNKKLSECWERKLLFMMIC